MRMPSRVVWLPAVAILLPCAFVGALGYRWLSLERDAAARRGTDAARGSAATLAEDLRQDLRAASIAAAAALEDAVDRAPFASGPPLPALVADAFLFDSSGRVLDPDIGPQSSGNAVRAFELLALARRSHASDDTGTAERLASTIGTCCAEARDEYGMSLVLYAAWMRAGWYAASGDAPRLAALAAELRTMVDAGVFGRDEDVTAMSLLAQQTRGSVSQEFADFARRVADIRARVTSRAVASRDAAGWLSTVAAPQTVDAGPVLAVDPRGDRPVLRALTRTGPDRLTVIAVDRTALADRIAAWAAARPSFDIALSQDSARSPQGGLVLPLFREAPVLELVIHPRASDPATERRRDRLFASSIIAALMLTIILAYLAMRDVTREIATASLRSAFVAGVTHELKTPVASIRLLAETLRAGRARPEATSELLDTIVDEADRLTGLVDNVLTSSRIDSGAHVYHPRQVSVADVVRSAIRRFDSVLRRGGFVVTQQIEEGPLPVVADPDALERSVLNLLGNAVKYSGAERQIRVVVARRDGYADISVADDGIGIPSEEQQRIFERFYRSPSAAADTAGTGLGLALARHFVEAHAGRISVRSETGRGSVFSMSLPLAGEQPALDGYQEAAT